jgi:hypothetical protein
LGALRRTPAIATTEVSVRADKHKLRTEVDELLRRRPGWKLQMMATPGLPPVWGFGSGGQVELSVGTDRDSIRVYVVEQDLDVTVHSTSELAEWLKASKPQAFQEPKDAAGDKPKRRRFLDWE